MNELLSRFKWLLIGGGVTLLIVISVLVFVLVGGPGDDQAKVTAPVKTGATPASGGTTLSPPAPIQKVSVQKFNGKGNAKEPFKVGGGVTIFKFDHKGRQNFVVQYSQGDNAQLVVNEIGNVQGSKALGLPAGDYVLDVATTGEWSIQIGQSIVASAPGPPRKLSGSGQAASDFFSLKAGPATFKVSHQGSGTLAPTLLRGTDGSVVTILANELGRFSGSKTVEIPADGVYLVDVIASGAWSIDVSQ